MILYMYIAPRQGLTTLWGQNFYVNRNILSLWSFVASFKKISLKSDFIQFFSWFYTCIWPQPRGRQPPGDKILMSRERPYHCMDLLQVSKKSLWSLDFILFFSWFNTCIYPRGRWNKVLMSTEMSGHFGHLLLVSNQTTIVSEKSIVLPFSHTKA